MPADGSALPGHAPRAAIDLFLAGLTTPARLLVAISGGSDSTALLHLLHRALQEGRHSGIDLCAATVDHGLRAESAVEAAGVAALCARLSVDHRILRWEESKPSTGLAAAARAARYRLLCEAAEGFGADCILSAHTADDQVETVAMRAARNDDADSPGLAGMAPAVLLEGRFWLFRPLLSCRRAELRALLTAADIGWFDDPSNDNLAYERPRRRLALRGKAIGPALASIEAARCRRQALSEAAADFVRDGVGVHGGAVVAVDAEAMAGVDDDVLSYALAHLAAVVGGRAHVPSSERMQPVVGLCRRGEADRLTAGRAVFDLRRSGLFIIRERRGLAPLRLAPGAAGLWDERYRIGNAGPAPIEIVPAGAAGEARARALFPDLPPGVARMGAGGLPALAVAGEAALILEGKMVPEVSIARRFAPFDRFLPLFDRKLAAAIAAKSGLRRYDLPFRGPSGENEC